ncbi:MAG: hypothetical protein H0X64_09965 [Gemmatimonadaceae bacterium]|nr:hypothetical protein [Gemmatimonadaceae bacterium]
MKHRALMAPLVAAAIAVTPTRMHSQVQPAASDQGAVCYGFSFGQWTPALDRAAAGHDANAQAGPGAPDGRGWATSDSGNASSLMLFPGWWPAGVRVALSAGPPAIGESAKGTAFALVADARKRPPSAPIVVHGVPCRRRDARREPVRR